MFLCLRHALASRPEIPVPPRPQSGGPVRAWLSVRQAAQREPLAANVHAEAAVGPKRACLFYVKPVHVSVRTGSPDELLLGAPGGLSQKRGFSSPRNQQVRAG